MMLSPRLIQLFTILLKEDKVVPVKKLAEDVKVSKRTVQRELDNTEGFLKKYGLRLNTKAGTGIWLEGERHSKELLLEELESNETIDYINKEKRRTSLILEILKDREPKKLYYYSNILGVSEATISNDMETIKEWFDRFELTLIRKQGYGVTLEGTEKNYRLAVKRFLDENPENGDIKLAIGEKKWSVLGEFYEKENKGIFQLIDYNILKQVLLCLGSIRDKKLIKLTNSSYCSLVLHITIAIMRIKNKDILPADAKAADKIMYHEDYALALRIAESLEKEFHIRIPEAEIAYILLHISGSKIQSIDLNGDKDNDRAVSEELLELINEMVNVYDRDSSYELKQDEEFIMGLLAHLKPTFIRLKNGLSITNPLLLQIQETYPDIYGKCKAVGEYIEKKYGFSVPEDEIGYLVMHFGAAGVRLLDKKESLRKVDLGIICVSGIGISRLMHSKLKNFLRDRVQIYTYGKEDLSPGVLKNLDFMISNVELEEAGADVLMVSPLLTDKELKQIDEKVKLYAKTPKKSGTDSEFSRQLEHINFFINQIKGILKDFQFMKVSDTIPFEELLVAVSERISPFNANRLTIQEDIKRREKISSQIIPEYGFALLHSRTGGVVKPNFSLCVTKDRTPFLDPYFKGIRAVVIMLIPEDDEAKVNGDTMGFVSSQLIEDTKFLNLIFKGEQEEIRDYLEKILRLYFKQYLETV
ncbi:BglG family transcription antiterminator [Anaerocolumna xylanovorans]|uniref:Mannitol operon transcriptional antiterminator n=1 Tax=Anaerocolumna xylanovorans DSM 12503 TaxID=1121345 RepID=A0A1M7YGP4_9FIRM|nr:BglG family transcription antiterminator [Anaerocolumna xylanovorans]SHO51805.1 mannitol operon transcriptional antiterminator [Anaerocolumna xylanovorans DSM 12503]